jgi:hypothetical protein
VPRVHKQFVRTETLRYEGEEWTRDVFEMRAFAKQKVIRCMEIKVHTNGTISTTYGVENITDAGTSMFQWYPEANIPESNTEEIALAFAEGFLKDNPDTEYYGN